MFGSADHLLTLNGTGAQLDADLAALRGAFGTVEVIEHQNVPVPGSANGVDLRAQDPARPVRPADAAADDRAAGRRARTRSRSPTGSPTSSACTLGGTWDAPAGVDRGRAGREPAGPARRVRPRRARPARTRPTASTCCSQATAGASTPPSPAPTACRSSSATQERDPAAVLVLVLATIGLLFVGLLAVAGFTVMAQRRLRALGMLGAIGASHRHIRLVLLANGRSIGGVGAPRRRRASASPAGSRSAPAGAAARPPHRPVRPALAAAAASPWLLAVVTAVVAAWWPARAAARVPVVAALSGRPAPPRPAHRFAAVGATAARRRARPGSYAGAADQGGRYIVGGVLATALGAAAARPGRHRRLGAAGPPAPLAPGWPCATWPATGPGPAPRWPRSPWPSASPPPSRSAPPSSVAKAAAPTGGNLPADQMVVWLSPERMRRAAADAHDRQLDGSRRQVDAIAADLHATRAAADRRGRPERAAPSATAAARRRRCWATAGAGAGATGRHGRQRSTEHRSPSVRRHARGARPLRHRPGEHRRRHRRRHARGPTSTATTSSPGRQDARTATGPAARRRCPPTRRCPTPCSPRRAMDAAASSAVPVGWLIARRPR